MAKNYTYPSCPKSHKGFRTPCKLILPPPPLKIDNQLITGKNITLPTFVGDLGRIPLELSNPFDGFNHYPAELSNPFDGFNHYPAELSNPLDGINHCPMELSNPLDGLNHYPAELSNPFDGFNHHPDRKQKTLWETQGIDCITHKTITV